MATKKTSKTTSKSTTTSTPQVFGGPVTAPKPISTSSSLEQTASPWTFVGSTSSKTSGVDRNMAKEAEARALGMTQAEIDARGGINSQGYFNDVPANQQLTAEEYKSVTNPNGTINTLAMLDILNKKQGITGTTTTGTNATNAATSALAAQQKEARQSAYDLLLSEFTRYGLGSLVEPLKGLIQENISPAEFGLRLQQTDAYKKRFAANADRIAKGLVALSPAEYIAMEDQYQNIMRNYGLPATYYTKDSLGTQEGFQKLLANDVSAAELEDRVNTAQSRVINANPQVKQALKQFYPDITDGDILAYTLDPTKALTDIKRKVTAAEIGGAAIGQGLATSATEAQALADYGITKAQAQQGYQTIADVLPVGQKLSQIYGETPYTQQQAEQEIFNLANSAEAAKKRKRLAQREVAQFGGSAGTSGAALSRDRALSTQSYREPGAGAY